MHLWLLVSGHLPQHLSTPSAGGHWKWKPHLLSLILSETVHDHVSPSPLVLINHPSWNLDYGETHIPFSAASHLAASSSMVINPFSISKSYVMVPLKAGTVAVAPSSSGVSQHWTKKGSVVYLP